MAEDPKAISQRVYRRKPADIAEAKFIAGLVNKFVKESTKQLAEEERHDELYTVMDYQRTWNEIVKDLVDLESGAITKSPVADVAPPPSASADETKPDTSTRAGRQRGTTASA